MSGVGLRIDWDAQPLGQIPDNHLADQIGCHRQSVTDARRKRGIPAADRRLRNRSTPKRPHSSPAADRFRQKFVESPDGCWIWIGWKDIKGYGRFNLDGHRGRRRVVMAHRYNYEQLVGQVPAGFELDHLCRRRACVNPTHLEVVTHRENVLRGIGPTAENARRTSCVKCGGPLDPKIRRCRPCKRAMDRIYMRRHRAKKKVARR